MSVETMAIETIRALEEAFRSAERSVGQHKAFNAFCKMGLPTKKNEEYRFTPIGKFLEANFDLSWFGMCPESSRIELNAAPLAINIVNGHVFFNAEAFQKAGVAISIAEALDPLFSQDPFLLLNYAFNPGSIQIEVPAGLQLSQPIIIQHGADSEANEVLLNTHISLTIRENAACSVFESFSSTGINPVFQNVAAQYTVHENAVVNYVRLQNDGGAYQVYNHEVKQVGKSVVNSYIFSLDGNVVRNNSIFSIEQEFCESNFYGIYFPGAKSLMDNHTVADHRKPNCVSNELYKGIMGDQGKAVFNGKIFVRPDAQKTNAFQSNRNILLTDNAVVNTKPQLEIWANDVKCSHGCTTGQLDKDALFYLQARGISADKAKEMLLMAFAGEVISKVPDESLQRIISNLIAGRLADQFGE